MSGTKKLGTGLTAQEKTGGFIYLVFSLFFLPTLLGSLNGLLAHPLGKAWTNFLYYCLNFLLLTALLQGFLRKSLVYAGKHIWPVLGWSVLGFGLYWLMNFLLGLLLKRFFPDYSNLNDSSILSQLSSHFWITAIGTVLLVPLAEELMHRALVFGTLYKTSPVTAYIVSAAFFAMIHVLGYIGVYSPLATFLAALQYLPAGWVLAWCYRKSGCIYVPMTIHAAINAMGIFARR